MQDESLYEKIGGEETLKTATDYLYARVMLDDKLAPFFKGMNVTHIEKRQREFLSYAFGGPEINPAVDLRAAHSGLISKGLSHRHFDLLLQHLDDVLVDINVSPIDRVNVIARVEETRIEVMGEVYSHSTATTSLTGRVFNFLYGNFSYAIGMFSLVYSGLWMGDILLPTTLDSPRFGSFTQALVINIALIFAFAVQHSVMARPAFKAWFTQFIPTTAERSTYVLVSGIAFLALMYCWQPLGIEIWNVDGIAAALAYTGYAIGWALLVSATFAVNHFDLFGLRQVWLNLRGIQYTQLPFSESTLYKYSRHPLYVGWLMVIWFTPHMTISHLFFASGLTAYIFGAISLEEKDLKRFHPEYASYQQRVAMLIPGFRRKRRAVKAEPTTA